MTTSWRGGSASQASGLYFYVGTAYDGSFGPRSPWRGSCGWPPVCSVLAIPLSGCGTGSLWDKFTAKDDTFIEEPADKLYNEGLYLMNQRKDPKAAVEEVRGSRPPASLFRLGAQIAADVGLFLLQGRRLRQLHRRRDPLRHPASRQPGRRLRAISDRGLALRPDSGHLPRSGPHRKGHRRARRSDPQISDVGICQQRQGQA